MTNPTPHVGNDLASLVLTGVQAGGGRTWLRTVRGEWSFHDLAKRAVAYQRAASILGLEGSDIVVFSSAEVLDQYAVLVAGILGSFRPIFAVGPAKVPLLESALAACAPRLVVTDDPDLPAAAAAGVATITPKAVRDTRRDVDLRQQDVPYISNTSGSLGAPRFIWVDGLGLAGFASWAQAFFGLGSADVWGEGGDLTSDLALTNAVLCLAASAQLSVVQGSERLQLARLFSEQGVTAMRSVPSTTQLMLRSARGGATLPRLRMAAFGGDRLRRSLINDLNGLISRTIPMFNTYGKAEVAGFMSCYALPNSLSDTNSLEYIPIGHEVPGVRLDVTPDHSTQKGELIATSSRVAVEVGLRGLRGVDTKEPGEVATLRTGDIVERMAGVLHFIGRSDRQVKVSGNFVNLEEIDARASGVLGVDVCSVLLGDSIALLVERDGTATSPSAVRVALTQVFPYQLVPSPVVFLQRIPRGPGGKIDIRACERIARGSNGK